MAKIETRAIVDADASGYTKAMAGVVAGTAGATAGFSAFKKAAVGLTVALAGFLIIGKAISTVINMTKTFIDFEEQLFRTSAIMKIFQMDTEKAAAANETLETEIRKVAAGSKFTATEVGAMAEVLALAGLNVDDLREAMDDTDLSAGGALKTMVDFAVVAGTDVETAAGIGIASLKGFGIEIQEMERVTSVLANTFTSSFVNLQQLGDSMRFFGPTANAAGVSISEAAAAVGALGNAGLQGSMAGTGLRQAINKLIAPTDDARRAFERLGLDLVTLTPAGETAKAALDSTIRTISGMEKTISAATLELKTLNRELSDMSVQEERNSINIARIRQRASKQNRALTKTEMKTIERLESANEDLNLSQREGALEARLKDASLKDSTESLKEQEDQFTSLKGTVESQTTGVQSLVHIIQELNRVGATTAEILEMFGVRGGGSILALKGQADAFEEIALANDAVFNAVDMNMSLQDQMVGQLEGSVAFALAETRSKFEELSLVVGKPFAMLITQEGGIKQTLDAAIDRAATMGFVFEDIADSVGDNLLPAIAEALQPENVEKFLTVMQEIVPVLLDIIGFLGEMTRLLTPILDGLIEFSEKIGIIETPETASDRENRIVGVEGESRFDSVKDVSKFAAAGTGIGATAGLVGGPLAPVTVPVGAAAGFGIGLTIGVMHELGQGLAQGFSDAVDEMDVEFTASGGMAGPMMAEGGIVMKPIFNATIGEAGAEAIIPLSKLPSLMGEMMQFTLPAFQQPELLASSIENSTSSTEQSFSESNVSSTEQVINLSFESINIGAGNSVTATDVRQIIESEMPKIIRSSLTRGVRGVL